MPVAAPPQIVSKIVQQFRRTGNGIVVCRYHRLFNVHAGPGGQTQDFTLDGIYEDGALVKVRMLRFVVDGRGASASQIQTTVQAYEHPKPGDVFEAPWRPAFENDYRDGVANRDTIMFTALKLSYGHGNGTFTYNAAHDVTSYRYSPTVMPQHATRGVVSGRLAEVLPGYWAMTQENQTYSGSYSVFAGHATVQITQSRFRRFGELSHAERFIAADHL